MKMNRSNIFEGGLVRLSAISAASWEIYYRWSLDTQSAHHLYEIPFPSSPDRVRTWVEAAAKTEPAGEDFDFRIERLDGEMVGAIGTHHCNLRFGTFMYGLAIMREHQRKGYASEAIRLLLRYYFQERRYQKVNIEIYSFNEPSIRLHENLGFVQEGRLRRSVYTQGQYFDKLQYGMTCEEFEARWPEERADA